MRWSDGRERGVNWRCRSANTAIEKYFADPLDKEIALLRAQNAEMRRELEELYKPQLKTMAVGA